MVKMISLRATEVLDSRGTPTLCVRAILEDGSTGMAMVPSGASVGRHEALELRDHDPKRYFGKGVLKAVDHVNGIIAAKLKGMDALNQRAFDEALCQLDGTDFKTKLGANALLGASLAIAHAAAAAQQLPLYKSLTQTQMLTLPMPMMNLINGGVHADNRLDFQEVMIVPVGAQNFREAMQIGAEVFHNLKTLLSERQLSINVGDEGGFAPNIASVEDALSLLLSAIERAGYRSETDVCFALDCAASEFYNQDEHSYNYKGEGTSRTSDQQVNYLEHLVNSYPIVSIEDGMAEDDWEGWSALTQTLNTRCQLVGDDLFVTNPHRLQRGITNHVANAILIKMNQIGTVTETLDVITQAHSVDYTCIVSHRSGETEDTSIADLAVATNAQQIKTGSISRSERIAKYNRLMMIEDTLGADAKFFGRSAFTQKH